MLHPSGFHAWCPHPKRGLQRGSIWKLRFVAAFYVSGKSVRTQREEHMGIREEMYIFYVYLLRQRNG